MTAGKPKKPVKYNPKKHIVPMREHEYMAALDSSESFAYDFIIEQIGTKRFNELNAAMENGEDNSLKDVAWAIVEHVATLFKTPQEQFEYCPYSLGGGEDYQPSKNFYSPKDFDNPLGQIDD